ncbi:hypothetical protein [Laspinema olomoucense]|uniref:hypothetical protein n=1 Tax=Laspinema olomoucense TaxID=3231600 RepID=UPI0021BAE10C|nr:hypothetical protein [Laspinema sp. D3d]MCT7970516.1 hypothetical protein [Laspinema sp. D3d]
MLRGCKPGIPTPGCDDKALRGQGKEGDRLRLCRFQNWSIALLREHPILPKPGTRN